MIPFLLLGCTETIEPAIEAPPPTETPVPEPIYRTEVVVQGPPPPVDVLFVVDNSSSMGDEQAVLQASFPGFVQAIVDSGLDFHIAVVATDTQRQQFSGKLVAAMGHRYIDETTPDPLDVFDAMVGALGVSTGSEETGRAAAYLALEDRRDEPTNVGFLRPDAALHVVFVTDTFDNSGSNPIDLPGFIGWGATLKPAPDLVRMHAVIALVADPACTGSFRPGTQYLEYATVFGGNVDSICEADWTPLFTSVAVQAASLRDEFLLDEVPDPSTIEVTVLSGGAERTLAVCDECEVVFDPARNTVVFVDGGPEIGSEVRIAYVVAAP
ncbi:MAG: VWA domain-containing protein [Alphaproteobacteria bacterium]|nr:VWA domain-containing protein [Alphaproteobacteria bacterium]